MISVWDKELPKFNSLDTNIKVDVLVIGGGMAGILCAHFLKKAGIDYALVEGKRIGSGITKNTTAKITAQHGLIYDKLIRDIGIEKAEMYLFANQSAVAKYKELCKKIDCDFEEKNAFVYSLDNRAKIEKEIEALNNLHFKTEFTENISLPFKIAAAVKFPSQAQFNPIKFIGELSKDLNIYENTFVHEMVGTTAVTNGGTIEAKKVIVCTHFPFINKHGSYFLKLYQHRSYVIALENAPQISGMYLGDTENGMSFRNYKNLLLVGGGDHRTGKKGGNWQELRIFANCHYPQSHEKYYWAAQDCMTLDGIPYIGNYSSRSANFYIATGFNKWGMTSAMVAAEILCDLILDKKNQVAPVFSPSRSIIKPQLAVNAFEAITNLLTFSKKRCPHLGCALKWNSIEHSWDCPCHGSRFNENGHLIDNPATGDLKH